MVKAQTTLVVDADGHVLEPADLWQKYLELQYRDRAIRIDRDERDYEVKCLCLITNRSNFCAVSSAR